MTKGKSNTLLRIVLDAVMILLAATLFSKNVISLLYHEIAGLALIALFLCHLVLNRKWIAALFKRKNARPSRLTFTAVLNVLLTIAWLAVLVTGVLVSKKVFGLRISALNPWHFFASAVALLLTGVHFGMHWSFFWGKIKKRVPLPRVIAMVLMIAVIGFGCYSLVASSYTRWISAPFRAQQMHGGPQGGAQGEAAQANAPGARGGEAQNAAPAGENGQALSPRQNGGGHGAQPFTVGRLLNVLATDFSLIFLFAAATHGVDLSTQRKKKAA